MEKYKCNSCNEEFEIDSGYDRFCYYCGNEIDYSRADKQKDKPIILPIDKDGDDVNQTRKSNDDKIELLQEENARLLNRVNELEEELEKCREQIMSMTVASPVVNPIDIKIDTELTTHNSLNKVESTETKSQATGLDIFNTYMSGNIEELPKSFEQVYINAANSKGKFLLQGDSTQVPVIIFRDTNKEYVELYPTKIIKTSVGKEYYKKVFYSQSTDGKNVVIIEPCIILDKKIGYYDLVKIGKIEFIKN